MEDQESLKTSALISKFSDSVKDDIDQLLSDGVVTTGVVVSGIFFTSDELFGVEQLSVCASSDLINDSGFQVNEDSSGDVFASAGFAEEGVEGIVATSDGLVTWHLTIGLDSVLKAVQLPASVSDLNTGLTYMN